jgi:hypothetical protein
MVEKARRLNRQRSRTGERRLNVMLDQGTKTVCGIQHDIAQYVQINVIRCAHALTFDT